MRLRAKPKFRSSETSSAARSTDMLFDDAEMLT